jgi:hypothetical protein
MATPAFFTAWQQLSGEPPGCLRLVSAAGGIALYRGAIGRALPQTPPTTANEYLLTLSSQVIAGKSPPPIAVPRLLPGVNAFDVVPADDQLAVAVESYGGARHAIEVGRASASGFSIQAIYRNRIDYRFPRFVRGSAVPPGHFISTIVNGMYVVMLADKPSEDPKQPFTVMGPGTDGVLIADGAPPASGGTTNGTTNGTIPSTVTLALFGKAAGPPGPPSPTGDFPGTLFLQRVTMGHTGASPQTLFDPNGTYGYDVDAQAGSAVLVAHTTKGPQLLAVDLASGAAKPIAWPDGYPPSGGWIANPTVLAVAGGSGQKLFSFAFYEGTGATVSGIRYGQIDLAQVP